MEHEFGKGVVRRNPLLKRAQKLSRRISGRRIAKSAAPFDWETGYDVRDYAGQIQIKDQGSSGSCGGQAGSYFLEIQRRLKGIREGQLSAKSVYAPIAYPGGGTTVTALSTQIGVHGANLEATVPSTDVYGKPLPEYMMEDTSWQTDVTANDALKRAGFLPYDIAEDIDTIASTIKRYGAVIWEIRGNNNTTWLTPTPSIKKVGPYWYHFMVLVGAKIIDGQRKIIALNSWGDIGDHGAQYFGEEWFTAKNIIDAFAFIPMAQVTPLPSNKGIWAAIVRWWKTQPFLSTIGPSLEARSDYRA